MGKDINGKELGKGITQRNDGRYNARVTINACNFSFVIQIPLNKPNNAPIPRLTKIAGIKPSPLFTIR